jgi:GNAT superfamily N-acetyltransferase
MKLLKLFESITNKKYSIHFFNGETLEDLGIDLMDAYNQAENIVGNAGIKILGDKELQFVAIQDRKIVGVLYYGTNPYFDFDIAVSDKYQRQGIAKDFVKIILDEFEEAKDAYGDDYRIETHVVNKNLANYLKTLGFEEDSRTPSGVTMIKEQNILAERIDNQDLIEQWANNRNLGEIHFLGSGDFGTAYSTDKDTVIKITSHSSELEVAKKLVGKKFDHVVNIYEVDEENNIIHQEYLDEDSDIEYLWYEAMEEIERQGGDLVYGGYDLDDVENEDVRNFLDELDDIQRELRSVGIINLDFRPENLGRKSNGNLAAFDIIDRK